MRSFVRTNHRIRVPSVRCVAQDGSMIGVMDTREAQRMAKEQGLDLVEVSPKADPPVCRIMDYGKYQYEESMKRKQAKKHHHARQLKEVKFHANVAEHDYQTKISNARKFLEKGHKVKISLTFRGRENAHRDLGFELVNRVMNDCEDLSVADMAPRLMGRSIVTVLGVRSGKAGGKAKSAAAPAVN